MVKCFNPDVVAVGQLLKQLVPVCTGKLLFRSVFSPGAAVLFVIKMIRVHNCLFNVFYFIRFIHQAVKVAGVKDKKINKKWMGKNVLRSQSALFKAAICAGGPIHSFPCFISGWQW